ncbi:MAG: carboxymuconolactone decarboxylase family protein [Nocardioidaceae bacterium]
MARVPETDGHGEVAARIRARRPGGVLRPIDKVLLHSPTVADAWNTLLGTLRGGIDLRADLRELVVMRIAVLNRAHYEWASHENDALAAGLTADQLAALREPSVDSAEFSDDQVAALAVVDAMTTRVDVDGSLIEDLVTSLGLQQAVELVVTIAAYNMVSRIIVALDVDVPEAVR